LERPDTLYADLLKRATKGFSRFWNDATNCCFDVLDGPDGNDPTIRPNQIFAVSLHDIPLTDQQQRSVVETCMKHLLTSYGLRSLSPEDSRFRGHYYGSQVDRDGSYHQGTVWGWLLGPFVLAHLRVYGDHQRASQFLEPMANHLLIEGLGNVSEIF